MVPALVWSIISVIICIIETILLVLAYIALCHVPTNQMNPQQQLVWGFMQWAIFAYGALYAIVSGNRQIDSRFARKFLIQTYRF